MNWRYDNTYDAFAIRISDFLTLRSIAISDITEARYFVKVSRTDSDSDALVSKTLGAGIELLPATSTEVDSISVQFQSGDFSTGALDVSECIKDAYYTGIGIKTSGMTKFLEIDLVDSRLDIVQDFIHD